MSVYEYKKKVNSFELDYAGRWRTERIFYTFMEAATWHAEEYGVGFVPLREKNAAWILSRNHMKVLKILRPCEPIAVQTWSSAPQGVVYPRSYRILNSAGEEAVIGVGSWALVNTNTHRLMRPGSSGIAFPEGPAPIMPLPEKMQECANPANETVIVPVYTDFDVNLHVNNVKYIEWMENQFPPEWHAGHPFKEIYVRYIREVTKGEVRLCMVQGEQSACFYGYQASRLCFEAKFIW